MNTDEKLESNELGQALQTAGRRLEEHATKIVAVVCGVLVVAAAVIWFSRQSGARSVQAWSQLQEARDVRGFGQVAEDYPKQLAGQWGLLKQAELNLESGMSALFRDRELAVIDLKKAIEGFDALARDASEPVIRERSLWGAAQALEALCDGDTAKATGAYQQLLKEFPDTYYKQLAEQRIEALKKADAQAFYAWFSKEAPKPTDVRPADGKSPLDSIMLPQKGLPDLNDAPAGGTTNNPPAAGENAKPDPQASDSSTKPAPAEAQKATDSTEAASEKADPPQQPAPTESTSEAAKPE